MGHEAFIAFLHGWGCVFGQFFFFPFKDPTHFGKPQFFPQFDVYKRGLMARLVPYQKALEHQGHQSNAWSSNPNSLSYKMFDDQPIYPTTSHEIMFE